MIIQNNKEARLAMGNTVVNQPLAQHFMRLSGLGNGSAQKMLLSRLSKIQKGTITITDGKSVFLFGSALQENGLAANVVVKDHRFYRSIILGGSIGAAEAYIKGFWQCDDLVALIRIILRNRDTLIGLDSGVVSFSAFLHKAFHKKRSNTLQGSSANIKAHYDIGNDLYQLFLDETMMYSCGIFKTQETTLMEASIAKMDRLCKKLNLQKEDHVIEIGSGWGGFAIYAALNYGCRVTTTTISPEQFSFARDRIDKCGLSDRITLLLEDYRELKGTYDKLVSIEMIEAVGHEFLATFFRHCANLLKNNALMALQGITITDQIYQQHIRSVDFIRRYIFPGGAIPSVTSLCEAATSASDLRLVHLEDMTPHYARTLQEWRKRFLQHIDRVRCLGYPEHFIRMWLYYLSYCEAGFLERYIGNAQMLFAKPDWRGDTIFTC